MFFKLIPPKAIKFDLLDNVKKLNLYISR